MLDGPGGCTCLPKNYPRTGLKGIVDSFTRSPGAIGWDDHSAQHRGERRMLKALHTKAIAFDRKDGFIGSLNRDPRSSDIDPVAGFDGDRPEPAAQGIA